MKLKPKTKNSALKKVFKSAVPFCESSSATDTPLMKEIYTGMSGKTQGLMKVNTPATKLAR
jgi:hypothetical protein